MDSKSNFLWFVNPDFLDRRPFCRRSKVPVGPDRPGQPRRPVLPNDVMEGACESFAASVKELIHVSFCQEKKEREHRH